MRYGSVALIFLFAGSLFAHCDWIGGPVVVDARAALEQGEVAPVLKWVTPADEPEIRHAFARTMKARAAGGEAREVSDRWFFETLVRVHRAAEGEPYTGLKGEEYVPEHGIEMAEEAIAKGSIDETEKALAAGIAAGLRKRFDELRKAKEHSGESVEAGRHYVHTYADFIHFVERLHVAAAGTAARH